MACPHPTSSIIRAGCLLVPEHLSAGEMASRHHTHMFARARMRTHTHPSTWNGATKQLEHGAPALLLVHCVTLGKSLNRPHRGRGG